MDDSRLSRTRWLVAMRYGNTFHLGRDDLVGYLRAPSAESYGTQYSDFKRVIFLSNYISYSTIFLSLAFSLYISNYKIYLLKF